MPFADHALAVRLEGFSAAELRRFADATLRAFPDAKAGSIDVAGGVGVFCLPDAPFNQATGLGLAGPVTAEEIDVLEAFYNGRGARARVNVTPFAHESLPAELSRRGYRVADFENVLVRVIEPGEPLPEPDPSIDISVVGPDERALWGRSVVLGFTPSGVMTETEELLARVVAAEQGIIALLARVNGEPAGTGELALGDGLGWFSADTTLPTFQGRGIQTAMQRTRLKMAAEAGCELAATESQPGSGSQRNMERLGFRVVYTRVDMVQSEG